jgi:hypothetical protein
MLPVKPFPRAAKRHSWAAALLMLLVAAGLTAAAPAAAQPQVQAFPSPLRFVSQLDLECFRTSPYTPPATAVVTRHLNPILANLPPETNVLGNREQLCVPVAKNNVQPDPETLQFIQYVDLSCYRISGAAINRQLTLRQLNPVLGTMPTRTVVLTVPQQLCVPVFKNNLVPPDEVRKLVSYIDLKCYLEQPQTAMNRGLTLNHLNPLLTHLARHTVGVTFNRQLCVPVSKNNSIPSDVLPIVQYVDLEKWDISTPALSPTVNLQLTHLNPVLAHLPTEFAVLYGGTQLLLPVAKNNLIPPG